MLAPIASTSSRLSRKRTRGDDDTILSATTAVTAAVIGVLPNHAVLLHTIHTAMALVDFIESEAATILHPHDMRRLAAAMLLSFHDDTADDSIRSRLPPLAVPREPSIIPGDTVVWKQLCRPRAFFNMTRLQPSEFVHLYSVLAPGIRSARGFTSLDEAHSRRYVRHRIDPADQLLLWLLLSDGNNPTVLSLIVGSIDPTTVVRYADHITDVINFILVDEVYWPSADERRDMYNQFACHPQAIALLDGTHCQIQVPFYNQGDYYSGYKNFHTQNYFIAVDAFGYILYISEPFEGHNNDRGAFNNTPFAQDVCALLSSGEYIIVDGGFPGSGPLLQPFTTSEIKAAVNEDVQQFMSMSNAEQNLDRAMVEHSIHILKSRARALITRWSRSMELQALLMQAAARIVNRVRVIRTSDRLGIDSSGL